MRNYDTPSAAEMYFNRSIFGQLYMAIAGAPPLAPEPEPERRHAPRASKAAAAPAKHDATPRLTLLDRLDGWFWRQMQKDREAYLARSSDVFDLERRIDALERGVVTRDY